MNPEEVDELLKEFKKDERFMMEGEVRAAGLETIFAIVGKIAGGVAFELTKYAIDNINKFVDTVISILKGAKITIQVTCPDGMKVQVDTREKLAEKHLRAAVEQCGSKSGG